MKPASHLKTITNSPLLSYVCFNPLFRATRSVRKKIRRQLSEKPRYSIARAY